MEVMRIFRNLNANCDGKTDRQTDRQFDHYMPPFLRKGLVAYRSGMTSLNFQEWKGSQGKKGLAPSKDDRGRGRGRGRGRNMPSVIQTHSLFEQGPSEKIPKPTGAIQEEEEGARVVSFKREQTDQETKEVLDSLLRDDLPDTLPGMPLSTEEDFKKKKDKESEISDKMDSCSLHNFSEGLVGKLIVRKSGRVQLRLGNTLLNVTMGTPCGFLQDVASVRVDGNHGDISLLGHIDHRLVCTPDFESLLDAAIS
ncbi:hypothetical protein DPMN_035473 [Dreissena polymorpha]|uniref:DNA-directed RNA polymerase III subunit RPC4 n=1 Tax=Dreissena polymorpha TaxID=45954 RepID=A0A9D4M8V1_DREPO|nr:hypothetical protein DPMN_035473 [Dreissena polymorpha]